MKLLKKIVFIGLAFISTASMAQEPKYQAAKGDTKKEACENAEWEARKNCIRLGTGGIPVGGVECVQCREVNVYQWVCAVKYVCK